MPARRVAATSSRRRRTSSACKRSRTSTASARGDSDDGQAASHTPQPVQAANAAGAVPSSRPLASVATSACGASDTGQKTAAQVVKLQVKRVLKGKTDAKELTVEKPEAGYALRAGNKGPFLLDATRPNPVILGRYGPDSYAFSRIEAALKKS